jgi:hypothetical protein
MPQDAFEPCEVRDIIEESAIQRDCSHAVPDVLATVVVAKVEKHRPEMVTTRAPVAGALAENTGVNLAQLTE